MAHAQKIKKQGVIGLVIHCERREGCELSNQDIDKSRTHLNYNLACDIQPMKPEQFLKKRISEVKHLKRDDIIYMVDWIVTLPKDVPQEDQEKFFELTFQFLTKKYNQKNVVSAWVHNDETTPHIHFSFIPVVEIDGVERLKCKDILTKKELKRFHPDLGAYLEQALGYMPSIQNNATINGNRTIKELKQQEDLSFKKSLENIHKHKEATQKIIDEANHIDYNPSGLLEKTRTLKKCNQIIDGLKHSLNQYQKEVLGLTHLVTTQKEELDMYRSMPLAKRLKQKEEVIHNLHSSIHHLEQRISYEENQFQRLRENYDELEKKNDCLKENVNLYKQFISLLGLDKIFRRFKQMFQKEHNTINAYDLKELCQKAQNAMTRVLSSLKEKIHYFEEKHPHESLDITIQPKNDRQYRDMEL